MAQDEIRVWSYEANFTIPRDVVRLLTGDTERSMGLLYDAELDWLLSQQTNPYLCAAAACDLIGAKLAKRPDISIAGQSARLSERVQWYRDRADSLRLEAGRHGGATAIGSGALLVLEDCALQAATGVIPAFHRNQFGHPENLT